VVSAAAGFFNCPFSHVRIGNTMSGPSLVSRSALTYSTLARDTAISNLATASPPARTCLVAATAKAAGRVAGYSSGDVVTFESGQRELPLVAGGGGAVALEVTSERLRSKKMWNSIAGDLL
jgi:hypothetical protein